MTDPLRHVVHHVGIESQTLVPVSERDCNTTMSDRDTHRSGGQLWRTCFSLSWQEMNSDKALYDGTEGCRAIIRMFVAR